jgi:Mn2+/Fe2+ NRAMP family transporter
MIVRKRSTNEPLNFTQLGPMRALLWSVEINGVIAVPIMTMMMLLACREDIMGRFVIRPSDFPSGSMLRMSPRLMLPPRPPTSAG